MLEFTFTMWLWAELCLVHLMYQDIKESFIDYLMSIKDISYKVYNLFEIKNFYIKFIILLIHFIVFIIILVPISIILIFNNIIEKIKDIKL